MVDHEVLIVTKAGGPSSAAIGGFLPIPFPSRSARGSAGCHGRALWYRPAMAQVTVTLDANTLDFIEHQVACGRFTCPSAVVRSGLRMLQQNVAGEGCLRGAADDAGRPAEPVKLDAFLAAWRAPDPQ